MADTQASDSERLDWLEAHALASCAHFDALRDSGPTIPRAVDGNSQAFRDGDRVTLFTVASQHVQAARLRDAIDAARAEEEARSHRVERRLMGLL